MIYAVLLLRRAQSQLSKLPPEFYPAVRDAIAALGAEPRPHGCKKLVARDGWRLRVGNFRVVYEIDDSAKTVTILDVGDRRDIYR